MKKGLGMKTEIELEVRDKDGKLISKKRVKADSWLKSFAQILRALLTHTSVSILDTSEVSQTWRSYSTSGAYWVDHLRGDAPADNDNYGILVGSGVTAVTRDDFGLATKINHGAGTGELSYGATTIEEVDGTPPTAQFRVIRTFTNNSGAPINVNELGLVCMQDCTTEPVYTYYFLFARDVLESPISVPDGATLTVRYIPSVTA